LRHLAKEVSGEIIGQDPRCKPDEYADLLILFMDAVSRTPFRIADVTCVTDGVMRGSDEQQKRHTHDSRLQVILDLVPFLCVASSGQIALPDILVQQTYGILLAWIICCAQENAGLSFGEFIKVARAKLKVNKKRTYPRPRGDEITEHVRTKKVKTG
jgi:hypothetical protein